MKFDPDKILEEAKQVIVEHNLYFMCDVMALISCSKTTFYDFFPDKSDGSEQVKELLVRNRVAKKVELRKAFEKGASAEKIALYKLIATESERKALTTEWRDHSNNGGSFEPPVIKFDE